MPLKPDQLPAFFFSNSDACPYLPNRVERKLFTYAGNRLAAQLYDELIKFGFRRSQYALYRTACPSCSACLPVRIRTRAFQPSNSQKRILHRNRMIKRRISEPVADHRQFELFQKYLRTRHQDGSMAEMTETDYVEMLESTAARTRLVLYHDKGDALVAACITDIMNDGISMLYSYFDPDAKAASLGKFMVLDHVRIALRLSPRFQYVYLGYWIPTARKMDYKSHFSALEVLRDGEWRDIGNPDDYLPDQFPPL